MVDDATHRMRARYFEAETTRASYDVIEGGRQQGGPGSLSVDRDSSRTAPTNAAGSPAANRPWVTKDAIRFQVIARASE